jgi:hypothetical protein
MHVDNEKKMELTLRKRAPEVEKDTVSDDAKKVIHGLASDCDTSIENLNVDPSEQTAEDNSGSLLDPKESMGEEDGVEPLNLAGDVQFIFVNCSKILLIRKEVHLYMLVKREYRMKSQCGTSKFSR